MKQEDSIELSIMTAPVSTDFSFQFNIAREYQKVEKKIFGLLCDTSKKFFKKNNKIGVLVVLGIFDMPKDFVISGMRQIGVNPIQKFLSVATTVTADDVRELFENGSDGAIIVNRNGQIIGGKIYLTVDSPSSEVPEGCGTRHISAASFSRREDVISVFTLSEETYVVRAWKDGEYVEQFSPEDLDRE
jgi:DNA integrity scanning protein DisA with diadenylate cyclase activity